MITKACVQWNPVDGWKKIEPETARSQMRFRGAPFGKCTLIT